MSDSRLVDITGALHGETDKAYRVFDGSKTEWVPKSQVERHIERYHDVFTMPEWLAKDKGFI